MEWCFGQSSSNSQAVRTGPQSLLKSSVVAAGAASLGDLSRPLYKTVEHSPSVCHFVIRLRPRRWSTPQLLLRGTHTECPQDTIYICFSCNNRPEPATRVDFNTSDQFSDLNRVNCDRECRPRRRRRKDQDETRSLASWKWGCPVLEPVVWGSLLPYLDY